MAYSRGRSQSNCWGGYDLIIAHPPCTYLTVAGNRWFNVEKYGDKAKQRIKDREKAIKAKRDLTKEEFLEWIKTITTFNYSKQEQNMTRPKKFIRDILITYSDGSQELFQSHKEPMIIMTENRFNELSQFYEKYYKMVMAIKNDKNINALSEMQRKD